MKHFLLMIVAMALMAGCAPAGNNEAGGEEAAPELVELKDIAFEKELRKQGIHTNQGATLRFNDKVRLTLSLRISYLEIRNIEGIRIFKNLRRLYLTGIDITDADLKEVAQLQKLELLLLDNCPQVTDAGLKELAKLQQLGILYLRNFRDNKITGVGLGALAKCRELRTLNFRDMGITDAGMGELAKCQQLTSVRLSGCNRITDMGIKELAKLKQLTHLSVRNPSPTDAGIRELSVNLKQLEYFGGLSNITDKSLKELAKLKHLTNLNLEMAGNITDDGIRELGKLRQLESLRLYGTQVTDRGSADLKTLLPNCSITFVRLIYPVD